MSINIVEVGWGGIDWDRVRWLGERGGIRFGEWDKGGREGDGWEKRKMVGRKRYGWAER